MRLRVVSWDGDTSIAEDSATYPTYLPDESGSIFSQTGASPDFLKQSGVTPKFLNTTPGEWYFPLKIKIASGTDAAKSSARDALAKLFPISAERGQEKVLIAKDIDDSDRQWQVTGAPIQFSYEGQRGFVHILIAVAEPRWVEVSQQSDTHSYATGVGRNITPNGNWETDPILEITPSTQRSSGNTGDEIAHFVEIVNPAGQPALINFAIDLTDDGFNHAADVGTADSLANGDDIRVEINGSVVNRWLQGANTATCKVWTHIDLPQSKILELGANLSAGGSETEVTLQATVEQHQLLTEMPSSGQFKIGTERFTYTGKKVVLTNNTLQFTGVKRGVLQSSKAAHTAGDSITWIPNQIWVYMGNTSVTGSPNTSNADDFKPAFELTSTNDQWVYDTVFFDHARKRTWAWTNAVTQLLPTPDNNPVGETEIFTANEHTFADPASVLGQHFAAVNDPYSSGYAPAAATLAATLEIPFGIKAITVEGRKHRVGTDWVTTHSLWYSRGKGDWTEKWNDSTTPASPSVWENLGAGIEATLHTLDASNGYRHVAIMMEGAISGGTSQNSNSWQIDKATIDFNAGEVPVITDKFAGNPLGTTVTEVQFVITNSATGDSIEVNARVELSDTIILDFENYDFYISSDNQRLPVAVRPSGNISSHWFRLMGGETNTITITDAGMPTTSMVVKWQGRQI